MNEVTIDQVIANIIGGWTININGVEWPFGNLLLCAIALVLSLGLCSVIGIERERRGRSAGLRTHLLVGVGSCIIMIISIYGFPAGLARDVARLAAQVITGIGFLGAGAIIHKNSGTRGLTTAATIWIVMAIGIACGSFNFILATAGTFLIVLVLTVFRAIEAKINRKAPLIVIRALPDTPLLTKILEVAKDFDCSIEEISVETQDNLDISITFLAIGNDREFNTASFVSVLEKIEGVRHVGVMNSHTK